MDNRRIPEISTQHCPRKELGDLDALAGSINRVGLLHPIGITRDNELVYGLRRLKACEILGWDRIPVIVVEELHNEQDDDAAHAG